MAQIFGVAPFVVGTDDADQIFYEAGGFAWLDGGAGNDRYEIFGLGSSNDVKIVEAIGGGIDTVVLDQPGAFGFVAIDGLAAQVNTIENLLLTGMEGTSFTVFGNDLNNLLSTDGSDSDTLDGGAGIDTMAGGGGDDRYFVSVSGDVVIEGADQGYDRVFSEATYVLSQNVEYLRITSASANVNATGNSLDNFLSGNNGNNVVSALGGNDFAAGEGGNDTLLGGDGNDQLWGGQGNDLLDGGAGTDTLYGHEGNDNLMAGAGDDWLQGDEGNDRLDGGVGNDTMFGMQGADSLLGGAGNDVLDGGEGDGSIDTLAGGTGDDEYYISGEMDLVVEAAGGGDDIVFSDINYTLTANVESLNLFGDASVGTGNASNNFLRGHINDDVLTGLAGNDVLDGAEGGDTMIGGAGNDRYLVDDAGDVVSEGLNQGTDSVFTGLDTYTLSANVENLTLGDGASDVLGIGNQLNNLIVASSFFNVDELRGLGGNDTLDGGEGGADSLYGGAGDDTYILRSTEGRVIELAGQGTDTVRSFNDHTLANNVEKLVLIEGGDGERATGNSLANTLTGNSNDNFLWGRGGNDTMIGGAGDDTYVVEQAGDVVSEALNGGDDTVNVLVGGTYTMAANVENAVFAAMAGNGAAGMGNVLGNRMEGNLYDNTLNGAAGNDTLLGNAGDDTLLGGAGNDFLDGGRGVDSMVGGAGNDLYIVNSLDDVVAGENSTLTGGGTDTVESSVTVGALWAGVENLTLTGMAGNATGNELNNIIIGNALRNNLSGAAGNDSLSGGFGNDTLDGGAGNDTLDGGESADSMAGGTGSDQYVLDNAGDSVSETTAGAAGGIDTVTVLYGGEGYTLGVNVENLVLLGDAIDGAGNTLNNSITGNGADNFLYGDAGNDTLIGNAGNDTLSGGTGNDALTGGAGNDVYYVDAVDTANELLNGGDDLVRLLQTSAVTYFVPNNVEDALIDDFEGAVAINITGNVLDNALTGNNGANKLVGGAGNDTLQGLAGNDTLTGDAGDDQLDGGVGIDSMTGGAGNDLYFVSATSDVVVEGLGGGADTIVTAANVENYTMQANVENLDLNLGGTGGTFTGNTLANEISFSYIAPLTGLLEIDAGDGNDTVVGAANPIPFSEASLAGGNGTDTLQLFFGEGSYDTLGISSFEVLELELDGAVAWHEASGLPVTAAISLSGSGSLEMNNVSFASSFSFENYDGALTLSFGDDPAGDDTLVVRLDGGSAALNTNEVEFLDLQVEGGGSLNVAGTNGSNGSAEVHIGSSGSGSLGITVDNGQVLHLGGYAGARLDVNGAGTFQDSTIGLENSNTMIVLNALSFFNQVTLDTTGGDASDASDVMVVGPINSLRIVGEEGDELTLETLLVANEGTPQIHAESFLGNLLWTNEQDGAPITFFAGGGDDFLQLAGGTNETLNYGLSLDGNDVIMDDAFGGDSDTLNASFSGTYDGGLFIQGIETVNLNFQVGGTSLIDASMIQGTTNLVLSGGEGGADVTVEGLQVNVNGAALGGSLHAAAGSDTSNLSFVGTAGNDDLAGGMNGDSLAGGLGNDILTGGDGTDQFRFDSALGASNVDSITDFDGVEFIVLDHTVFAATIADGEGSFALTGAEFFSSAGNGGAATDGAQRIIYDTDTGNLYYDADGSGIAASTQFAQLNSEAVFGTAIPDLTASNFLIVS